MHVLNDPATRDRAARHLRARTARLPPSHAPGRTARRALADRPGVPAGQAPVPCPLSGAELRQLVLDTLG